MDQVHLLLRLLNLPQAIHARGVNLGVGTEASFDYFLSLSTRAGASPPSDLLRYRPDST